MKKYLFGILSIAISAIVFAFALPGQTEKGKTVDEFYYEFTGTHGQESDMSKWEQLADLDEYEAINCPSGNAVACRIINTTNSGGHPTSVPLSGGLPVKDNTINIEVLNRQ